MTRKEIMAIEAVVYLASATDGDDWRMTQQIDLCAAINAPTRYIESNLNRLSDVGILISRRGRSGGYAFGGRQNLTLWDVVSVLREKPTDQPTSPVARYVMDAHEAAYRDVRIADLVNVAKSEEKQP